MIVRYITHHDLIDYRHWTVTFYAIRGDDKICFVASWTCCCK